MAKSRSALIKDFAEDTTCHGIAQIYKSTSRLMRGLWIILVLAVLGALVYQITDRIKAYYSYSTTTKTSEEFVKSIPLPAITICNFNRYFDLGLEGEREDIHVLSSAIDFGFNENSQELSYFNKLASNFSLRNYMITKGWELNDKTIVYCTLTGMNSCSAANFKPVLTNYMGLCWTLLANVSQKRRGSRHGFHIALVVHQDSYTENPLYGIWEAGIKFQVHPAYEPPQVESLGLSVGVGQWASASIHKEDVRNMHIPWGSCRPERESLKYNSRYTFAACLQECHDIRIIELCGCREPTATHSAHIPECTPLKVINCTARERYELGVGFSPDECNCSQPCHEVKYPTLVSYSAFPNQVAAAELEKQLNLTETYVKENVVGLSVYFDSLSVTKREESKATTESALLSDIGGQLGLWIGISVVTLCEFLQFCLRMSTTFNSERNKRRTAVTSKAIEDSDSITWK